MKSKIYKWINKIINGLIITLIVSGILSLIPKLNLLETFFLYKINTPVWFFILYLLLVLSLASILLKKDIYFKRKKGKYPIKAIVFDFDGTISTCKSESRNSSWEKIWESLGYSIEDCESLYKDFRNGKLGKGDTAHQKWCDITCLKFRQKGLNKAKLKEISEDFELLKGTKQGISEFKKKNIKIYLLSGSIIQMITYIWGDELDNYFDRYMANRFQFDNTGEGLLNKIIGTKYDFEGKSNFIKEIIQDEKFEPKEVLFVGNSDNDVFAYKSGVQTLCYNAILTDPNNKTIWNDSLKGTNFNVLSEFISKYYL